MRIPRNGSNSEYNEFQLEWPVCKWQRVDSREYANMGFVRLRKYSEAEIVQPAILMTGRVMIHAFLTCKLNLGEKEWKRWELSYEKIFFFSYKIYIRENCIL